MVSIQSITSITQVTYNCHGLQEWTYFDDGHATLDTYDGLGRHMATKRYTMETQVFGEHETQVPVYQSTRSYTGDGVICEDGRWRIARFAGGYFTPDPVVLKPVNPGLLKTAANVREIPDTLSIAVLAKLGGAHYYITDHQGNNVAVADSTGRVEQRTDYYPYGTQWANSATHPFLYSGKEWLSAHGLNEYDFDARRYAPLIPRFTTLDPLCEKHPDISPYVYCSANPVNFIDPTGCDTIFVSEHDKLKPIGYTNAKDPNRYLVTGTTAEEIKEKTANGEPVEPMENSETVAILPDADLVDAVLESVVDANKTEREQGGHQDKEGNIVRWDQGSSFDENKGKQSITPWKINGVKHRPNSSIKAYWHVHSRIDEYPSTGWHDASPNDIRNDLQARQFGFKGSAFVVGGSSNRVRFYKGKQTIGVIKIKELNRLK